MVKVLEHKKEIVERNLSHRAQVQTDEPFMIGYAPDMEALAYHAAVQAGYHPAGFDLYSPRVEEIGECLYLVEWKSAKSCE